MDDPQRALTRTAIVLNGDFLTVGRPRAPHCTTNLRPESKHIRFQSGASFRVHGEDEKFANARLAARCHEWKSNFWPSGDQ